jgi:hypothetical protein
VNTPPGWFVPGTPADGPGARPGVPTGPDFVPGVPLGGAPPGTEELAPHRSGARELLLVGVLLLAAIGAAVASLLSWRHYGRLVLGGAGETGWVLPDGSMGRGWVAVTLGVLLALAGVLIAADRARPGRLLAAAAATGLVVFPVLEWGLGAGQVRSGPGTGLWLLLAIGCCVFVALGTLGPEEPRSDSVGDHPAGRASR